MSIPERGCANHLSPRAKADFVALTGNTRGRAKYEYYLIISQYKYLPAHIAAGESAAIEE